MKKRLFLFFSILQVLISQTSYFISDDRLDNFLNYMQNSGKISLISDIKPYSKTTIVKILRDIDESKLSVFEQDWLNTFESNYLNSHINNTDLLSNISSLPIESIFSSTFEDSIRHFIYWSGENSKLTGQIRLENEYLNLTNSANIATFSYRLDGEIDEKIFFSISNRESSIFGDSKLALNESNAIYGNYFNQYFMEGNKSTDASIGYIVYNLNQFDVWLGKIPFSVGSGESGKFVLNGFQTTPFTSFGLSFKLWKIRYHMIHGSLLAPELKRIHVDTYSESDNTFLQIPDKYLVSHRFEVDLSSNFQVHYNEVVVYGNRSIDLNYLNPFSFLRPLEHELYDRDNVLISVGFKWQIANTNLFTYHDILLDEWKFAKIGTDWFGNKHGILNGLAYTKNRFEIVFEHVAIRPFVYTHKFDVNRYTHDAYPLGYEAGPNSQTFYLKSAYQFDSSWRIELSHRYQKNGLNLEASDSLAWNIGGDIFKGHTNENSGSIESISESVEFLSGNIIASNETKLKIDYQPNYYFNSAIEFILRQKKENLFRFTFSLNY